MFIYKITNIENNKVYIGLTVQKNPLLRFYRHISNAKQNVDSYFYNSIRKYGSDKFNFEVIFCANNLDNLNWAEKFFIDFYKSCDKNHGYNILPGGNYFKMPEAVRLKISETIKNQFAGGRLVNKSRKGMTPWNKGLKGLPGPNLSKDARNKIRQKLIGKKRSDKTKQILSEFRKNYYKCNIHPQAKSVICLNDGKIFDSAVKASLCYNLPSTAAARVCNGSRKHYKGYIFSYAEIQNGQ